jgi:hypothetical protein
MKGNDIAEKRIECDIIIPVLGLWLPFVSSKVHMNSAKPKF